MLRGPWREGSGGDAIRNTGRGALNAFGEGCIALSEADGAGGWQADALARHEITFTLWSERFFGLCWL